ncbi:hypothetical protein SAMN02745202_00430 [Segatella oulorum]|uniref:DUF7833 domain-containing protein n=2 Tax=Segatella oulorum TaxID=28136 RepID=A0A1T4LGU8_9BACT|nr:hypothetical protein SAMN02745202_00430 [Segatella oulorum]
MRDFVYLCPNNLMRSALQPTGQSSPKQNETNATNCRTACCNLIILTMQNKEIHTRGAHKRPHQPKVSGKFLLLDTRLLNSPDLFRLRETMGMEGWGMALFVLNYLLEHGEWGRAPLHAVTDLARMCHKNKRSMMALLTDYPTLFEIEAGGKVFNSPYLRQCLGGEKIKINQKSCGLETLTNEPSDNQSLSLHRIKDERIKKKNDEEKETTAADAADAVAKKAEKGAKQPAASGTEEAEVVGRSVVKGAKQRVTSGTEEAKMVGHPVVKGAKQRVTSGTEEARMVARSVARGAKQPAASGTEEAKMVGRSVVKGAKQRVTSDTEEAEVVGRSVAREAEQRVTSGTEEAEVVGRSVAREAEQRVASAAQASPATNALPHRPTKVASLASAKAAEENAQHVEQATASPTNSAANAPTKAMEESAQHVEQATASPTDSAAKAANAPAKATKESAQHMEQATASPTNSATKAANASAKATEGGSKYAGQVAKQPGFRLETVFTDLAQAARKLPDDERQPLRTTWEILAQLYADSLYWQSLERLVGLKVYSQERWKRLALRWFFTYCVTQAKPISALNDAKSYLNHLLQPGRNTRQAFEHYAQTQYEADCRAWQHYRQWCINNHHSIP